MLPNARKKLLQETHDSCMSLQQLKHSKAGTMKSWSGPSPSWCVHHPHHCAIDDESSCDQRYSCSLHVQVNHPDQGLSRSCRSGGRPENFSKRVAKNILRTARDNTEEGRHPPLTPAQPEFKEISGVRERGTVVLCWSQPFTYDPTIIYVYTVYMYIIVYIYMWFHLSYSCSFVAMDCTCPGS